MENELNLTPRQIEMMKHAWGFDSREPGFRNNYCTSLDDANMADLIVKELFKGPFGIGSVGEGHGTFHLTEAGISTLKQMRQSETERTIKSFLQKMKDQDNRSTASPYYYAIKTKVSDVCGSDQSDEKRFYWNDEEYESIEAIKDYCAENDYSEEETEETLSEATECGIRYRWEQKGMFLTETDAVEHLRRNHYHYSPDAFTFVAHAWRAPELEGFLNALFDRFDIKPTNVEPK